ncbi:MAG: hypothetical protein HOL45_08965 [Chloroflexi bacterium]|nr:hypothetical protein [Chloroflexota bacterium]
MASLVIAISAMIAIGVYSAESSAGSNTIEIVPLGGRTAFGGVGGSGFGVVDPDSPTGGGLDLAASASLVEIVEKFESHHDDDDRILGQVLTRIDLPEGIETGNLVMDMIWSNSIDVGGILKKPNEFLNVGLYYLDSDQREADDDDDDEGDDEDYLGDCTENTQRSYKSDGITRWLCPDTNPLASATLSVESAFGILSSSIDGHNPLYVLAYIPKIAEDEDEDEDDKGKGKAKGKDDDDGDGEVGSVNSGQIKKMEFVYTVISVS